MKEKENINENKQELESKDLKSSTNTKEIKQDSKNNTETKNKNSKNNTESYIKLDSNGDEIIWELKTRKNVFFLLWSWIAKLGAMAFCVYFIFTYLHLVKWSHFVILLALLSVILYVVITSYTTLNLKGMYATKNNFYIEKYFG